MASQLGPLFTVGEAAAALRVPADTLAAWRHRGSGPTYIKLNRRVMYRASDLQRFIADNARNATFEAAL